MRVEGNLLASSPERSGLIIAMEDEGARGNHVDGVIVRNNLFVANNFAGIAIGGIVRNVLVDHNRFYQNGRQGVTIDDDLRANGSHTWAIGYERLIAAARARLSDPAYADAWAVGEKLSLDEAKLSIKVDAPMK